MGSSDRRTGLEALFLVWYARMILLVIPVRRIHRMFPPVDSNETPEKVQEIVAGIRKALKRTDRYVLWKNRCLAKSLAGRMMLNRRGIVNSLFLGAGIDAQGMLIAHAWLKAEDIEVIEQGGDFRELHVF